LAPDGELAVGAGAVAEHFVDVGDFFAAAEFVDDVVDEVEVFKEEVFEGDFDLFAEVDEFAIEAVAGGAPLIFHDEGAAVEAEALVVGVELIEFGDGGLEEGGDGNGFVEAHGEVHDAELEGGEVGVWADVPPDFLGVVDAVGFDEEVDEVSVFAPGGEVIGDVGAGELIEYFAAVTFEAGLEAEPEGGISGEAEDVGDEVAGGIHDVDGGFAVFDADVDMEAEDEVGAGDGLHVLDDGGVAFVGVDFLFAPVGEGVCGGGGDAEAVVFGEADDAGAEFAEVGFGFLDVAADTGADFDDGLVHFGLDAFGEDALAFVDDFSGDM